jgi:type 1 fimbria pilin
MKIFGSARGVGLRLEDDKHRQLIPGEHSEPLIMSQGNMDLVMHAMLERIPEELIEGEFHTTVNLNISYQ